VNNTKMSFGSHYNGILYSRIELFLKLKELNHF